MRRVRLTASGLVQGVFFRAATRDEAQRLGITGWVRNTSEGTVEVEAQGPSEAVDTLIEFCRQGPGQSRVEQLKVEESEPADHERGFRVR